MVSNNNCALFTNTFLLVFYFYYLLLLFISYLYIIEIFTYLLLHATNEKNKKSKEN
jgi:hypothetical protein